MPPILSDGLPFSGSKLVLHNIGSPIRSAEKNFREERGGGPPLLRTIRITVFHLVARVVFNKNRENNQKGPAGASAQKPTVSKLSLEEEAEVFARKP